METFLLNPNNTAQNTVSQQGISTAQSEDNSDFSPVMDEAEANFENTQTSQDPETLRDMEELETALLSCTSNVPVEDETITDFSTTTPEELLATSVLSSNGNITILTNSETANDDHATIGLSGQTPLTASIQSQAIAKTEVSETSPSLPGETNPLNASSKAESILLQQIQQILDQEKENGVVIIRGNELPQGKGLTQTEGLQNLSNPLLADAENGEIQAKQVGIELTTIDAPAVSTQKTAKLEGAHQDVSEQFLNAKLDQSKSSNKENSEQSNSGQHRADHQNNPEISQSATSQPSATTDAKSVEPSFGQQLGQIPVTENQVNSIEGKFAPGAANAPVPEKELVSNLIQRFNVNPRLQTSKLTMQLNPAELGSLKIDILVEGDSIKANIVAQSQQVLEILEKNMPRLRTVLEEQGFKVDSFEIAMNADGGQQKELFQEQFSSQQQQFASSGSSSRNNESFDTLLDSQEESENPDEDPSGVNLTV